MKRIIFLLFVALAFSGYGQKKTSQNKKQGYYTVNVVPDKNLAEDETKLVFTFIGPTNKPARSNVKIVCNNDSAWPNIDILGNYSVELDPGKYKMRFVVPFWHEIITDSIFCKKQTVNNIVIRFQAKDN